MLRAVMSCETPEFFTKFYAERGVENPPPFYQQLAPGMGRIASFNPEAWLGLPRDLDKQHPEFDREVPGLAQRGLEDEWGYPLNTLSSYGVVDSPAQFEEMFRPLLEEDPRDFFVAFTEVRREDEPQSGGWRYEKWGPYYGTQKPQYEYLYDDTHIERVFTYQIFQL